MKATLPLLAALALGAAAEGCESVQACTLIGCLDGVSVTLVGAATKVAASLPVTLTVCLGTTCSQFRLDKTGAAPTCTGLSAGNTLCTIDGEGTVVLSSLPIPDGTADGSSLVVHATATDKTSATLFDVMQTVTIVASQPNGPDCAPTCHEAQVSFMP